MIGSSIRQTQLNAFRSLLPQALKYGFILPRRSEVVPGVDAENHYGKQVHPLTLLRHRHPMIH